MKNPTSAATHNELGSDPVFGRSDLRFSADGRLAAIGVEVGGDKTGLRALAAICHLRSTLIPQGFGGTTRARSSEATPPTTSTSSTP